MGEPWPKSKKYYSSGMWYNWRCNQIGQGSPIKHTWEQEMIWFWGRWYYPMLEVRGIFSFIINCVLFVIYMALTIFVLLLVGAILFTFVAIFSPCWLVLLFL